MHSVVLSSRQFMHICLGYSAFHIIKQNCEAYLKLNDTSLHATVLRFHFEQF